MKLVSEQLGELEFTEQDVVSFPDGLPGFAEEKAFLFVPVDERSPFAFMQSVQNEALCFLVLNPFAFYRDYDFELPEAVVKKLEIEKAEDVQVWNIVVAKEPFRESTVNLQAPIVVNVPKRKAKQVVLNDPRYPLRQRLGDGKVG
ncbi:flagellar assembly protein FliW [Bacillaceae bacterium]